MIGEPNDLKVFGSKKKGNLNRRAKIDYGHLCPREINSSFII
jgi:hypothetical protein